MSFSLTRKTDYALLALARLSQVNGRLQSVSARVISSEFNLPLPVLTNILKDLGSAGLIDSRRGAAGGYYLHRPPTQITLAQVVAAIEGPVALARCCDPQAAEDNCPACKVTPRCPITHTMHRFNDAIHLAMRQLTLAQMMQDDLKIALKIESSDKPAPTTRSLTLAQTA
jgi:Rrf2 family protein